MYKNKTIEQHNYKVLDKGFIKLVDYMGSDASIVDSARVSYGQGTKTISDDKNLINYLMRHRHTSPFEMCEVLFHVKLPIFVARQWIRHRTASVNEISGRYSELPCEIYTPQEFRKQSKENKQGSSFSKINYDIQSYDKSYTEYMTLLNKGVSREMARIVLPLGTYTEWYWKIDLHNLMHFLKLRLHKHAQEEIRLYANKMMLVIEDLFPMTFSAFNEYILGAINFSKTETIILSKIINMMTNNQNGRTKIKELYKEYSMSKREQKEFESKMIKMGYKI